MKKNLAPNNIYEVEIWLTRNCNLKCRMCNFWTNPVNSRETSDVELKRAIDNLYQWFNREFKITFVGGEPFLRRNWFDIVSYASHLGIITTMVSNGTLLNSKAIDLIFQSGLIGLTISIDSLTPAKHDYMRGVPGSFEKAYWAVMEISKRRREGSPPFISIASIVSKYNHMDVIEILKMVHNNKIGSLIIQPINTFFPLERKWFDSNLWPVNEEEKEEICASLSELAILKQRGYPLLNDLVHIQEMKKYFLNLNRWWE